MASSQDQVEKSDLQLKHLGFVRVLTINTIVLVSNLYDNAKQSSGSLKSTLDTVENAVTTVVGPVYDKIKGFPADLLVFLDHKVDEGTHKFDEHAPPIAKTILSKAQLLAKKASEVAGNLAEEAKVAGPLTAVWCAGSMFKNMALGQLAGVWNKVNNLPVLHGVTEMVVPTALGQLSGVWNKVNQLPVLHGVTERVVPTAAYLSEKYNNSVKDMAGKGFRVFNYVPLVPLEEMSKAYKQAAVKEGDEDPASTSDGGSDKE